jgi:PAS domain S-box-containing protein
MNIPKSTSHTLFAETFYQFGVAFLYILFGYITKKYLNENGFNAGWLSSGVALAALLLGGWRYLYGVFLGIFFLNFLIQDSFLNVIGELFSSLLEVALGFWLISRYKSPSQNLFPTYLNTFILASLASLLSATVYVFIFVAPEFAFKDIFVRWTNNSIGILLIVPLAISWQDEKQEINKFEGALIFALSVFAGYISFLDAFHDLLGDSPKGYIMFLLMTMVAIKIGMRGVTVLLLIMAIQAIAGAYQKVGFFSYEIGVTQMRNYSLYFLTQFIVGLSISSYIHKINQIVANSKLKDQALNIAANSVMITNTAGEIEWTNQAFTKMTGFTIQEVKGLNPRELVKSGKQSQHFYKTMWDAISQGQVWQGELVNQRKDGSLYDQEMTIAPLNDERGKITHFVAVVQEITQRKKAEVLLKESEQQLRKNEARLRSLIDISPIPLALNDNQQNITFLNHIFTETFGYDLTDIPTLEIWWQKAYPDENYRKWVMDVWQETFEIAKKENKAFVPVEVIVNCKNGSQKTILVSAAMIDESIEDLHLVALYDITERKKIEQELKISEFRWKFAVDGSGDGIWDWDIANDKVFFSIRWKEMIGFTDDEMENTFDEWEKRVHPDDAKKTQETVETYLAGKTPVYINEHRLACKDGSYKWILARGIIVEFDENHKPSRMVGIHTDISERKKMELDLKRSNADLEQFAYAVSHDMRQPLRMVTSYLSLIEKALQSKLDDDTQQFLTFAIEGAKRMDAMILSLLDYSRIGRQQHELKKVSSRSSLDEALMFLKPALDANQGTIHISGDWGDLTINPDELTRLFQNLIGNALKYHKENEPPIVSVSGMMLGDIFRVEIKDSGIGIATHQTERLFKVFSRLQARSHFEGTGIGLALCRKIIEYHGGQIGVVSEGEGFGSTFWFELPVTGGAA